MEIERAVRGSGDARLRAKFDAPIYTIRRALALYPYVRSPSRLSSLLPLHSQGLCPGDQDWVDLVHWPRARRTTARPLCRPECMAPYSIQCFVIFVIDAS